MALRGWLTCLLCCCVLLAACSGLPVRDMRSVPVEAQAGDALYGYPVAPVQTGCARRAVVAVGGLYRVPVDQGPVYNLGRRLADLAFAASSGRAVYIRPLENFYTRTNTVWSGRLRFDGPPGDVALPPPDLVLRGSADVIGVFRAEQDQLFCHNAGRRVAPNWYFPDQYTLGRQRAGTHAPKIAIPLVIRSPQAGQAEVVVALNAESVGSRQHRVRVCLNDGPQQLYVWDGIGYHRFSLTFDATQLRDGINQVCLTTAADQRLLLDFVEVRTPVLPQLPPTGAVIRTAQDWAGQTLAVPGLRYAVDITDFGGEFAVPVARGGSVPLRPGRCYFLTDHIAQLDWGPPQPLAEPAVRGTTHIAIAPNDMVAALEPLRRRHAAAGLRPVVITLERVLDVYGGGIYSPAAIECLVQRHRPRYLLLAASANRDYCNRQQRPQPLIRGIPAGSRHVRQYTVTDDIYTVGYTVQVGRIIALDRNGLAAWVDKAVSFAPGASVVLLAGASGKTDFTRLQSRHQHLLPGPLLSAVGSDAGAVRARLAASIAHDAGLVVYQGHAQSWELDHGLLRSAHAGDLPVANWLLATCNAAYYHADYAVLLRTLLTFPGGGAVGAIAATSVASATAQDRLVATALRYLAAQPSATWGDLFYHLKRNLPLDEVTRRQEPLPDHLRQVLAQDTTMPVYALLADPALPVIAAKHRN